MCEETGGGREGGEGGELKWGNLQVETRTSISVRARPSVLSESESEVQVVAPFVQRVP